MFVGVNALSIAAEHGAGAEFYLRNVLATIRLVQPDTEFVIFSDEENHDSFEDWPRERLPRGSSGALGKAARAAGCDVLFSSIYAAPQDCPLPLVVYALELYTLASMDSNRRLLGGNQRVKGIRQICRNARVVVVPTEYIRRQLLERLEVPLDRSTVASLGVSEVFGEPQQSLVEEPYLLAVSDTHKMENVSRLMEAFQVVAKTKPHTLVLVGQPCEDEQDDWGPRVVRIEECSAAHLAGLYQHCDVFVCASLYDGSGVTVLEAMRSGTRVAASLTGSIKEVAGDVPIYFDAENVGSIVKAMRRGISEDPKERERHTHFGRQNASEYTWEKCAWKTLAAFKRI